MSGEENNERGLLYKFSLTVLFVSIYASGVLSIGAYSYGQFLYPDWLAFAGFGVFILSILMVAGVFISYNTDWDTIQSEDEDEPSMTTEELEKSEDISAGKPTPSLEQADEEYEPESNSPDTNEEESKENEDEAAVNLDNTPTASENKSS